MEPDNPDTITIQHTPQQAATLQELERKAHDRIRVYNPTEEDFIVLWGGLTFEIPAKTKDLGHGKGQQILPRYIARNYVVKMTDRILGNRLVKAVKEANDLRASRGMSRMNHWEERDNFEAPFRTDNIEARDAIRPLLWLGIEEEFGGVVQTPERARELTEEQKLAMLDRPARKLEDAELPGVPEAPDPIKLNEAVLNTSPTIPDPGLPPIESVQVVPPPSTPVPTPNELPGVAMDSLIADLTSDQPKPNGQ